MSKDEYKDKQCSYNDIKRTNYFHGMLMTERDFSEEQNYHIEKRKLLNRMLHGWGVVCGLKVKATDPASANLKVEPGMALDCHGNEILVCEEQLVDLTRTPCSTSRDLKSRDPCFSFGDEENREKILYVVIRYKERGTKPEVAYVPGEDCEVKKCNFSRIQEGFCIEVWDYPPVQPQSDIIKEPCNELFPCPSSRCCTEPHYLLLAAISCGKRIDRFLKDVVDNDGKTLGHCHIIRTLDKVCIDKNSNNKKIEVEETYAFEFKDTSIYDTIEWISELPDGISLYNRSQGLVENKVSYTIDINNISSGKVDIKSTLKFKDNTRDIASIPYLVSSIEIGTTQPVCGETISAAMIRNLEHRKYVSTFPLFAWLFSGMEAGKFLSGNMSLFCQLIMEHSQKDIRDMEERFKKFDERIEERFKNLDRQIEEQIKKLMTELRN